MNEKSNSHINVGKAERVISGLIGGWLISRGIQRGSLSGIAQAGIGGALVMRAVSGHCSMYSAMDVNTTSEKIHPANRGIHIDKSIFINRPASEIYRFWRDLRNLEPIMSHIKSIKPVGEKLSHWTVDGPAGTSVSWASEIINDVPDEMIAWSSLPDSKIFNAGSVHFKPSEGSGTNVRVVMDYRPPLGKAGHTLSAFFGANPAREIEHDLKKLKDHLEAHVLHEHAVH